MRDMGHDTEPDASTRAAEEVDAGHEHTADRAPTTDEDASAEDAYAASDPEERERVAEHYEEMSELGANVKGEGQIE
jgi:hypothetical protein